MVTLFGGLVGGLVATIVMSLLMMAIGDDSPPPTAALWAKYVGDGEPGDYMMQGMVLHLLYGTVAGGVFGAFASPAHLGLFAVGGLAMGLVWGVAWGIALMIVGAVLWMRVVLGMEPEPTTLATFGLFHVVYGLVLGAWVGLGILG